jgi:DNA-binding protein YbaB
MFNKLKQIKDLRSQAKTMQSALAQETVTTEKNGISITMNGNMEITGVVLPEGMDKSKLESSLKDCINDTIKKTQKIMAQKMQEMGGFGNLFQ